MVYSHGGSALWFWVERGGSKSTTCGLHTSGWLGLAESEAVTVTKSLEQPWADIILLAAPSG